MRLTEFPSLAGITYRHQDCHLDVLEPLQNMLWLAATRTIRSSHTHSVMPGCPSQAASLHQPLSKQNYWYMLALRMIPSGALLLRVTKRHSVSRPPKAPSLPPTPEQNHHLCNGHDDATHGMPGTRPSRLVGLLRLKKKREPCFTGVGRAINWPIGRLVKEM
jgi:hypothetical protein